MDWVFGWVFSGLMLGVMVLLMMNQRVCMAHARLLREWLQDIDRRNSELVLQVEQLVRKEEKRGKAESKAEFERMMLDSVNRVEEAKSRAEQDLPAISPFNMSWQVEGRDRCHPLHCMTMSRQGRCCRSGGQ